MDEIAVVVHKYRGPVTSPLASHVSLVRIGLRDRIDALRGES